MFGSAPTHALASRPVSGKPLAMMMFWRSLWVWLSMRLRGPLDALGTSRLQLRVWPGDFDMTLHMNNARYFSVGDRYEERRVGNKSVSEHYNSVSPSHISQK